MRRVAQSEPVSSCAVTREKAEEYGFSSRLWSQYLHALLEWAPAEAQKAEALGVALVCPGDSGYPAALQVIQDRPCVLYLRGRGVMWERPCVAVVGTRRATWYGRRVAREISEALARAGAIVVSGMAEGIDAAAHEGAIVAGGDTVAVLGSGVDVVYPPAHKRLYLDILNHGVVVSELPLGSPPRHFHFPARNRVISGLSQAVVVVEAGARSGALITAEYALEQGKCVMAVPGNVTSPASRGTNGLIKDGALLVEGAEDVLGALGLVLPGGARDMTAQGRLDESAIGLDSVLQRVYDSIGTAETQFEQIVGFTGMPVGQVLASLTRLEVAGLIAKSGANSYVRVR